jgi:hypothetical protein
LTNKTVSLKRIMLMVIALMMMMIIIIIIIIISSLGSLMQYFVKRTWLSLLRLTCGARRVLRFENRSSCKKGMHVTGLSYKYAEKRFPNQSSTLRPPIENVHCWFLQVTIQTVLFMSQL